VLILIAKRRIDMAKIKFPILAVILLIVGIVWALNSMEIIALDLPWLPIILIVIAVGMIANRYSGK
jgi:hypothetical protein